MIPIAMHLRAPICGTSDNTISNVEIAVNVWINEMQIIGLNVPSLIAVIEDMEPTDGELRDCGVGLLKVKALKVTVPRGAAQRLPAPARGPTHVERGLRTRRARSATARTLDVGEVEGRTVVAPVTARKRRKQMSERQLAANRRNGARGRGPTSLEGKMRSRGGAMKHGMTAVQPVLLVGEAGEERARFDELRAYVLDGYVPRTDDDRLVVGEYVHELWRRYQRINPAEQALIREAFIRRRRVHARHQAQQIPDLLAHNPGGLQHCAAGLRYLIEELGRLRAATDSLVAGADVMQPVNAFSARIQHTLPALVELAARGLTKASAVTEMIAKIQTELRETLAKEEAAAAQLEDIEATICLVPAGKKGERLLRYLRQSDRRLAHLRRVLAPLRRPAVAEAEAPPRHEPAA